MALTANERLGVGRELCKLDEPTLVRRLANDMAKRPGYDVDAVTLHQFLSGSEQDKLYEGMSPDIQKVLTSSATALVRQDLEPTLYSLFVKRFPLWDLLPKERANGLVHAYNQITSPGGLDLTTAFISELGNVADSTSTYARKTISNIGVMASRRGVSLKEQFAVQQGGAGYDAEAQEIANGMTELAKLMQTAIAHANFSGSSGDLDTSENGLYTQYGFDGLRIILGGGGANSGNNAVAVTINGTTNTLTEGIDNAAQLVVDNGGQPSIVIGSSAAQHAWIQEQIPQVRFMDRAEVTPGVRVSQVTTLAGDLPWLTIPGGYLGSYTYNSATVEDVYLLDLNTVSVPYLGSPTFTMLEIPIGANAQLSRLFILFGMFGLKVAAPPFNAKIRR